MKKFLPFIFLLIPVLVHSQERAQVKGRVLYDSISLESVHIKNITSGKFSVSNELGEFLLSLAAGDTLVLSHVGMNDLISFVRKEDLGQNPLIFRLTEKSNELREVVVNEESKINAVSLGIIPKKIEKLSVNERRLRTAGDFKPIHLLGILGGALQIDPILNAINGRTKRLKRNVEVEKEQRNIAFLEMHFMDYMKEEMKLNDQEAQLLISFVIKDHELQNVITSGNEARVQLFLLDSWLRFEEQRNSE